MTSEVNATPSASDAYSASAKTTYEIHRFAPFLEKRPSITERSECFAQAIPRVVKGCRKSHMSDLVADVKLVMRFIYSDSYAFYGGVA